MGRKNKAGVAILTCNKIDFKTKAVLRDKEGHYIITKGTIQQEGITLVNIYAPKIGTSKYIKQILMDTKGEIDRNTVIVRDFITLLTLMDRTSRQNIKETAALNDTLDQMDLIDMFKAFHPKATKYTYFSSAHGTFSKLDHMIGHKMSQED